MKKLSLLGSTGSIGTQALQVVENLQAQGEEIQVEVLAEELALLMDRASEPVLWVGDRALDVGRCTGSYENDYCELTVPLSWIDDRDSAPVTELLMEHYKLAVTAGGEE